MHRFLVGLPLVLSLAAGAACGGNKPAPAAPAPAPVTPAGPSVEDRRKQLTDLLAEQWEYTLKHSPELASIIGDHRYNDQWSDGSLDAIKADLEQTRVFLAKFAAVDTTGFPDQEALSQALMVRQLKEQLDDAKFEDFLMPVNQFQGVHIGIAELVSQLPFSTAKDYDDYIARLNKLPGVFDQITVLLKAGMAKQLMPPKFLLQQCVAQTLAIANAPLAKSAFTQPVVKFPDSVGKQDQDRIHAAVFAAVKNNVVPAYTKFAAFLRDEYVPHGRNEVGVWALPDGIARYNALVKASTTTELTADQIHDIGLAEVKRIEGEQAAIGQKLGFADFAAFKKHIRANKKLYAKSREDILGRYHKYVDQMYTKLPALFGRLPKGHMGVEPMEAFREKEAAGAEYNQGTPDGSRPGTVRVNTYEPTKRLTIDMESTAYHEGVPGHHMQIAIQQELGDLPPFRQQANFVAFQEGWALYSERLGKEVGFYQDPYNDYGRLQDEMLRAIRLVVDTGLHAKHWTREQVVQFFHDHSTIDEPSVQSETNRYIAIPSQALGYKIGQLTISRLRDKASAALGAKFDIRGFHDEVLGGGALPLDMLEARIDAWVARQK
jgi:uncharacterized protein (DUF885 family)